MGIKKYFIESFGAGDEKAMFISPKGEFIAGSSSHIDMVTDNPKKFGYTIEDIRKIYEKYNERMGIEGKARDEILTNLISNGWIHIRRRPNKYWAVLINKMTKKTQGFLYDWSLKILKGVHGVKELNKNAKVLINSVNGKFRKELTISEIGQHRLQEEIKDLGYKTMECDVNELDDVI